MLSRSGRSLFSSLSRVFSGLIPVSLRQKFLCLGNRLSLLIICLVFFLTTGVALLVVAITDDVLLHSMVKRGAASAYSVLGAAKHGLATHDHAALTSLVYQASATQDDLAYIAILDKDRRVIAHSQSGQEGSLIPREAGALIDTDGLLRTTLVDRLKLRVYEFTLPFQASGEINGEILVGLGAESLLAARSSAHKLILLVAGLAVLGGVAGALCLSRLFERPITRLAKGVEQLKAGDVQIQIPVNRRDDLGRLTESFNDMAAELIVQRQGLIASSHELEKSYHDVVQILAGALDARDNYTYGHSTRVAQLAVMLGKELGFTANQLKDLEISCLLHDIGKICIPDNILNKKSHLNSQEHAEVQQHPLHGVALLELSASLSRYVPAVMSHHEWFNGQGYPHGLSGDQIPVDAQIIAIVDAYDAMTTSRPYREGLATAAAVQEIQDYRGSQFSPDLVDRFLWALRHEGEATSNDEQVSSTVNSRHWPEFEATLPLRVSSEAGKFAVIQRQTLTPASQALNI